MPFLPTQMSYSGRVIFISHQILLLLVALHVVSITGQQRGDLKIQLPIRSPIHVYNGGGGNPIRAGAPSGTRSLIQFDQNLDQDLISSEPTTPPPLQNDPTAPPTMNQNFDDEGIITKIKQKLTQRLVSRREVLEKLIQTKFNQMEKKLDQDVGSLLEKVIHLNQTLSDLNQLVNQNEEPSNELAERVDVTTHPMRKDNALLHFFSVIHSVDFNQSLSWSIHNWVENIFEYDAFATSYDEANQAQDRIDDAGDNSTSIFTVTSTDCGGPVITSTSGLFTFSPSATSTNFLTSGGNCIWRLVPSGAQSILVSLVGDGFFRRHGNASLTLVPQSLKNWTPLRYGVNYDSKTIKKDCFSEWNCHSWSGGPESTLLKTDRVINILKNGDGRKILSHRNREKFTFVEKGVFLILTFDPTQGPPPPFSVSFKGRDCGSWCPDNQPEDVDEGWDEDKKWHKVNKDNMTWLALIGVYLNLGNIWNLFTELF